MFCTQIPSFLWLPILFSSSNANVIAFRFSVIKREKLMMPCMLQTNLMERTLIAQIFIQDRKSKNVSKEF